jgi:hypothetical protein
VPASVARERVQQVRPAMDAIGAAFDETVGAPAVSAAGWRDGF